MHENVNACKRGVYVFVFVADKPWPQAMACRPRKRIRKTTLRIHFRKITSLTGQNLCTNEKFFFSTFGDENENVTSQQGARPRNGETAENQINTVSFLVMMDFSLVYFTLSIPSIFVLI